MSGAIHGSELAELRSVLGSGYREIEPPEKRAGARIDRQLEPATRDELSRSLALLSAAGQPVLLTGRGTRLALGNPIRDASIGLSCRRLSGIDELDAADGVVHVAAGTPISELAREVEAAGWLLPLTSPTGEGTVGGAVATAFSGPRRLGLGPIRDCVLGMESVLATGERVSCGARVIKNVTGYDMAKLYVGSLGTLGVIDRLWLRLHPRPLSVRVLETKLAASDGVFSLALAAARRPSARAVALTFSRSEAPNHDGAVGASWRLVSEFAGEEEVTDWNAQWLATGGETSEANTTAIDRLEDLQVNVGPGGVRVRVHVLPRKLEECCERLQVCATRILVYPEPGVAHAFFEPESGREESDEWIDDLLVRIAAIRDEFGAQIVIEELPEWAQGREDVFRGAQPLALMRALKKQFDPAGILNPGRFAGMI